MRDLYNTRSKPLMLVDVLFIILFIISSFWYWMVEVQINNLEKKITQLEEALDDRR